MNPIKAESDSLPSSTAPESIQIRRLMNRACDLFEAPRQAFYLDGGQWKLDKIVTVGEAKPPRGPAGIEYGFKAMRIDDHLRRLDGLPAA